MWATRREEIGSRGAQTALEQARQVMEAMGDTYVSTDHLLLALARKPRQAFTRELLLQEVWGYRHPGDTRLVNVHVQRLRSKVEKDPERPEIIVTVRGIGYRITEGS